MSEPAEAAQNEEAPVGTPDDAGASGGLISSGGEEATDITSDAANDDWRAPMIAGLDDDMAQAFSGIAGQFNSQTEFAKSVVELRKGYDSRIPVPGDDAEQSAWDKVYDRLGRPKEAKYDWNHIDDAPELTDAEKGARDNFAQVAHRAGLNQRQVDQMVKWNDMETKALRDAAIARAETITETNIKALKAEQGPDFAANTNVYNKVCAAHMTEDDFDTFCKLQLADGTALSDHPVMQRTFSKIGRMMAEDFRDATSLNQSGRESAQEEISKIESEARGKGLAPGMPEWPRERLDELYDRAYSTRAHRPTYGH